MIKQKSVISWINQSIKLIPIFLWPMTHKLHKNPNLIKSLCVFPIQTQFDRNQNTEQSSRAHTRRGIEFRNFGNINLTIRVSRSFNSSKLLLMGLLGLVKIYLLGFGCEANRGVCDRFIAERGVEMPVPPLSC